MSDFVLFDYVIFICLLLATIIILPIFWVLKMFADPTDGFSITNIINITGNGNTMSFLHFLCRMSYFGMGYCL
jgi:hypothetical protein